MTLIKFTSTDGEILVNIVEISHIVSNPDSPTTSMIHLKNKEAFEVSGNLHEVAMALQGKKYVIDIY